MSSPRFTIKKLSVEEQHEEFVTEIKSLKAEVEGLTQFSDELINENMTLININKTLLKENERLTNENEDLTSQNEQLKNIIMKLTYQSGGLTGAFLKLNCKSFDWEQVDP